MDINFFATYLCNSRCLNCSIWKNAKRADQPLSSAQLTRLFASPAFCEAESVGIAGGEPTIDPFFWQLLENLPDSKQITITTNGLSSGRLIRFLEDRSDKERFLVQISVDGIGDVHDRIRGIPGGFEKTRFLLDVLKNNQVHSLISFTINRMNYHQILSVYQLARDYGAGFSTRMAHCGGAYDNADNKALFQFNEDELTVLEKSIVQVINRELDQENHHPAQLVFWDYIVNCCRDRKKQRQIPCKAMETTLVIDLYGEVFPNCPFMMEKKLGNIQEKDIHQILNGISALDMKTDIEQFRCGGCWNDCQMVTNISLAPDFLYRNYNRIKMRRFLGMGNFPEWIDFSGKGTAFLLSGWHYLEKDGDFGYRWTEPAFALPVPAGTAAVELFGFLPEADMHRGDGSLCLEIEGMAPVTASVRTPEWQIIRLLLPETTDEAKTGNFRVSKCFCPEKAGQKKDSRKLGMAVQSVRFIKKDSDN